MPANDIFGWDLDVSVADILLGLDLGLSVMTGAVHTYSDPDDRFISGSDLDESCDGIPTTLVLGASITLSYTPVGGVLTGPIVISGHVMVATQLFPPATIISFIPDDPDSLDPNLLAGTFTINSSVLGLGLDSSFEICFAKGTNILTNNGRRRIETLKVGDLVQTMDNGLQPIRWIHSNTVFARDNVAPIRIAEGALGNDQELLVSPQHRMLINDWRSELLFGKTEVLATAKSLINDKTIRPVNGGLVTYYHFLCDHHEIVFANGAPSESFMPGEMGMSSLEQGVQDEIFMLFPDLQADLTSFGDPARMPLKNFEGQAMARYMSS